MCKVGGPRCEMTHTARARWGAKRKARTAYRRAMAHAIATSTHEPAMEKLVKNMNMADINELATYMGIDTDTVAASCDSQTYTSPCRFIRHCLLLRGVCVSVTGAAAFAFT